MPVGKKLAIVLSVVMVGASVAFFFRKDASAFKFWQTGPEDPFDRPVERRVTTDAAWAPRAAGKSASPSGAARRVPAAATAAIGEPGGFGGNGQPAFKRNLNPVGSLLPPINGIVGEEDESGADGGFTSGDERFARPAGQSLRHVVVDGDTLSTLAARYLGRAESYLEIFHLNRDVLASPELLPIGAVLKIPARRRQDALAPRTGGEQASPLKMVPLHGPRS